MSIQYALFIELATFRSDADFLLQKYLEAHKDELLKDKEFKEIVFKAHSTVEKKFHTNASKQPIHKVLKTITGWVQSERHVVESGPPASAPTGPRREVFLFLPFSFLVLIWFLLDSGYS